MAAKRRRRTLETVESSPVIAAKYGVNIPQSSERFLSPNDVGKMLCITGEAVKQWIYHRRLPAVKISNGYWKIRVHDLEQFLKAKHDIRQVVLIFSADYAATNELNSAVDSLGYTALQSNNIADAVLKAVDRVPALFVIDCDATDALKFAEKVRGAKNIKNAPILLIGGRDLGAEEQECAIEVRAQGFVKKGMNLDLMKREIQRAMNG